MDLQLSCGQRPIAKSSWERPGRKGQPQGGQPVQGTEAPSSGTVRPPRVWRNCGSLGSSCVGGVLVCQVPGTQTSDCGRRYGKDLSPPGRVLFCPSAPNTSRVASVGPLSLSRLTRKHSANCSHAPAGRLAFALSVGGLPRRSAPREAWKLGSTRWKAGAWTPLANPTLLPALEHGVCTPSTWQGMPEA